MNCAIANLKNSTAFYITLFFLSKLKKSALQLDMTTFKEACKSFYCGKQFGLLKLKIIFDIVN
jgi:hypothetical protein